MDRIANRQQTDTGPRHVLQGTCGDCRVQVVAGYDIGEDRWLYHVYLHRNDGTTERLTACPTLHAAYNLQEAFDNGMAFAVQRLNPSSPGEETPTSHSEG